MTALALVLLRPVALVGRIDQQFARFHPDDLWLEGWRQPRRDAGQIKSNDGALHHSISDMDWDSSASQKQSSIVFA